MNVERRAARHLVWAIPLAVLVAVPVAIFGGIALCGVSGCTGGGFGVTDTSRPLSWWACGLVGLIVALPFALVPWLRPVGARVGVALLAGLLAGGGLALGFVAQLS